MVHRLEPDNVNCINIWPELKCWTAAHFISLQVLEILVRAVIENLTDHRGEQASSLRAKLQELFGRISARCCTDAQIWRQYARLYGNGHSDNKEDNEKVGLAS